MGRETLSCLLLALVLAGCGGDDEAAAVEAIPAAARAARGDSASRDSLHRARAAAMVAAADSAAADPGVPTAEVLRETFVYTGGARDPFRSLLTMENVGPELVDLQLVGIYQNLTEPSLSVAVVKEKDGGRRWKLKAGDRIGRMRVARVLRKDVVFAMNDFGIERQETLSLRKQEDVTP